MVVEMGLRDRLKRLTREAEEGAVVVRRRDGTSRVFDDMTCFQEMFLAQMDLFKGEAYESAVLDAVRAATPESRRAFEVEYGSIEMEAQIIAAESQGGWVEVYKLLADGAVERARHEGDTAEARRLREAARQQGPAF